MKQLFQFFILTLLGFTTACNSQQPSNFEKNQAPNQAPSAEQEPILTGAAQPTAYVPILQNKRVACIVNQSSTIGKVHLIDTLLAQGIEVIKIFAPEHGFRGTADAGEHVSNDTDIKTGLPIISLYGKNKTLPVELLADVDILLFDIQDVGTRFYTYISTMHYAMESAAEKGIPFVVLDRPNPNGHYVDGPVLDLKWQSFVGMHPIPIVHGLTVGELAQMILGEKWIDKSLDLKVIPCKNYTHSRRYELPVAPSPNLPNQRAILLYPGLCLLEPTVYSVGRGTDAPFQHYGHPLDTRTYTFTPMPNEGAANPKWNGKMCHGVNLQTVSMDSLYAQKKLNIKYLLDAWENYKGDDPFIPNNFFDKIAGTEALRQQLNAGMSEKEIRQSWNPALDTYKTMRKKYLLYE